MKKLAWIILTFLMTGVGTGVMNAQDDKYGPNKAECLKYLSYYSEYYKQKNYADALPNWRKAYAACPPTANQNMLIQGISLLKSTVLPKTKDAAQRQAVIDSIMTLYDQRIATYPKYAESANNNKGLDLINFYKGDNQRLYDGLNAIIDAVGSNAKPSILMQDLNAAIELYKDGKLDAEAVIKTYQDNIALLETEIAESAEDETASETLGKVKADMEGLFITSKVASCENLIALFTPRYEANPTDIDLVSNIVRMMSTTDDCTDNDLFLKAATSMHRLQPSAQSAYFLYRLNASKDNVDEAIAFLEEAIANPDQDKAQAADYYYQLAAYCIKNNMNGKALSAAQNSIRMDDAFAGKAYMIIAGVWASASCGGDEIQRRSKYWVAADYMQKAMAADPSLAEDCRRAIGQYSVYYPKTEDAFMYDLTNGQSYTVSCGGMQATTTVRTQR